MRKRDCSHLGEIQESASPIKRGRSSHNPGERHDFSFRQQTVYLKPTRAVGSRSEKRSTRRRHEGQDRHNNPWSDSSRTLAQCYYDKNGCIDFRTLENRLDFVDELYVQICCYFRMERERKKEIAEEEERVRQEFKIIKALKNIQQ